ncbi:MAG: hypothetical protein EZS28_021655 [Streblomastix strix]|uniref:SPRY domain-containing protein n=1 Tax=Streblomastix strix TaxID=222440 RepID=A0A5J4VJL7_9EUKA|nr:MAG: hypothetical protein EZS28_021655 [Streblomastix strix]
MSSIPVQVTGPIDHEPIINYEPGIKVNYDSFTKGDSSKQVIQFDPLIRSGIVRFEVLNVKKLKGIGIANRDANFGRHEDAFVGTNAIQVVEWKPNGSLHHNKNAVFYDSRYKEGDCIALELNMDSEIRTLSLFVNGKMQNDYITHIPDAVRFWTYTNTVGDSFRVLKFERQQYPTGMHCEGSRSWKYGEDWNPI